MNERVLAAALQRGEVSALSGIIDLYTPYVYAVVHNILGDKRTREDVEEITADCFEALWYSRDKLTAGKLKGYLAAVARNKAISHLRALHIWEPLEEDVPILECNQPEDLTLTAELEDIARSAVDSLTPPDDEIFTRYYFLYQTTERIGADMNINPATVRTRLRRGRDKLKIFLEERGYSNEYAFD